MQARNLAFVGEVSREKLWGPGRHFGMLLPNGRVAHKQNTGVSIVSQSEFAQGKLVSFGREISPELHDWLLQRAYRSLERPTLYHVLAHNCEHYVPWLATEREESLQVNSLVLLALFAGLAWSAA